MALAFLLMLPMTGCGPVVAPEELGHVVFEVPKVPGCERPFDMPKLRNDPFSEKEREQSRTHTGPATQSIEEPAK